jgi:hypothetical protein
MDGDPAVEPELDGFSRILPLPYRVALIIVLGASSSLFALSYLYTHFPQAYGHGVSISTTCPSSKSTSRA